MAVRATMSDLIARVRLLVGDAAGGTQAFSDDQIQDWLDETRQDIRYEVLTPRPTYTPTGLQWNDYYSANEHWESSETLIWTNFTTLTPTTPTRADRIVGHWAFSNQLPAVLIAGSVYDVWAVAANLLEIRCANLATTTFDFTSDGQTFRQSQIIANLMRLAQVYRLRARPISVAMVRCDVVGQMDANRIAEVGPVSSGVPFVTGP